MNSDKEQLLKQLATLGDVTVTTYVDIDINETIGLKTQADAIIYFLQRLDIEMVDLILEDHRKYQNFKKSKFIQMLEVALDEFIASGDTYLDSYNGMCNSKECNFKNQGYSFVGNHSGNYFDLIFEITDGIVQDIYECVTFKCKNKEIIKSMRIEIDKSNLPF